MFDPPGHLEMSASRHFVWEVLTSDDLYASILPRTQIAKTGRAAVGGPRRLKVTKKPIFLMLQEAQASSKL